ncbi:DUF397 domain-containing protein [Streptomyces sp. NPDC002309]
MSIPDNWLKSSYSGGGDGNNCVEVAALPTLIAVRDSKHPAHGLLSFPVEPFTAFLDSLKAGDRQEAAYGG